MVSSNTSLLPAMTKAKEIGEEKVIIVISSLMVWNKTPKKWKPRGTPDPVEKNAEEGEEGEEEEAKEEEEPPKEEEDGEGSKKGDEEAD